MKKLVFAAIAAIVMVSVSNVFAYSTKASLGTANPTDTTVVDTVAPAEQPAELPVEQPADTTVATPSDSDDTAMLMMSDTTTVDSTKTDTASVNTPDVA